MSDSNVKDFGLLCNVLKTLYSLGSRLWRNYQDPELEVVDGKPRRNHDELIKSLFPGLISYSPLGEIKDNEQTLQLDLEWFRLPPLMRSSEFVPILKFKCDLNNSRPYVSFRIAMYRADEVKKKQGDGATAQEMTLIFRGLGLRFEMGDTQHDYCHMQMIPAPKCLDRVPEVDPCIPITAGCPVSLFICMVVSFYGARIWKDHFHSVPIEARHKTWLKNILQSWSAP